MDKNYYTIGEIASMFNLTVPTLRYYDQEGLFPDLERINGVRRFTQNDINTLNVIECLKRSKMEIKDIKNFIDLVKEGPSTYQKRRELFNNKLNLVSDEIEKLQRTKAFLEYKLWYYDTAIKDGNELRLNEMIPDNLPEDIKVLYEYGLKK